VQVVSYQIHGILNAGRWRWRWLVWCAANTSLPSVQGSIVHRQAHAVHRFSAYKYKIQEAYRQISFMICDLFMHKLRIGYFDISSRRILLWWWAPNRSILWNSTFSKTHIPVLVECANLRNIREKYFMVSFVADLFKCIDNHTLINFIKETHFYRATLC